MTEIIALCFILQIIKIDFKKVFYFFIASIVFHGILGIFQFINQNIPANKYLGIAQHLASSGGTSVLENCGGRFLRIYGGFTHPNVFGGFIVLAIIFLIILFFRRNIWSIYKKIIFWTVLGFLIQVLFFTFSRSAFLALIMCLFIVFIFGIIKKENKIFYPIIIFIFSISLINIIVFKGLIYSRIESIGRLEVKSTSERATLKEQSYRIVEKNWLLGVGLGNYIPYVYKNINSSLNTWDYQPVHNVYLLILSELGILGLLSYLSIFLYYIFYKFKKGDYLLILPIIIILVINFFDHYFWTSWSGVAMSFLVLFLDNRDLKFIS